MDYLVLVGAVIALFVILKLLAWPFKKMIKMAINVAIGVALLFVFNHFGMAWFGFSVPINWITALVVGLLGIPGFIGVIIFTLI